MILQADQRPKQNHKDVLLPAHLQKTFPIGERTWTDIEPQEYSLSDFSVSSKGHGKMSIHFAAVQETIEAIFRIVVSANQLSLYGAVAEMCEEKKPFTTDRGDLIM